MAILKKCLQCNAEFEVKTSNKGMFCSHKCSGLSRRKYITKVCLTCSTTYQSSIVRESIYCSLPCAIKSKINRIIKHCKKCNKEFECRPSLKKVYCTEECKFEDYKIKHRIKICEICAKSFKSLVINERKYCSPKCNGIARTTEYKEQLKIKQLTQSTLENVIHNTCQDHTMEFTDWQIEDIFKLSIIDTLNIREDVTTFSLK
jgi:hypothetical protein